MTGTEFSAPSSDEIHRKLSLNGACKVRPTPLCSHCATNFCDYHLQLHCNALGFFDSSLVPGLSIVSIRM